MSDRKLGYIIIFTLLIFLSAMLIYFIWQDIRPRYESSIVFSEVAALDVEDPVLIKGSYVGYVHSFTTRDEDILVHIRTIQPLELHEGYSIELKPKGVMGERFIRIDPGPRWAPLIEEGQLLRGTFELSPPEALAYIDNLRDLITTFMEVSTDLYLGSPQQQSLAEMFSNLIDAIDSLSSKLITTVTILDRDMNRQLTEIARFLEETGTIAYKFTEKVPEIATASENLISKLDTLLSEVDRVVVLSDSLLSPLHDSTAFIWRNTMHAVQEHFKSVRESIQKIQSEGVRLPVRPPGKDN